MLTGEVVRDRLIPSFLDFMTLEHFDYNQQLVNLLSLGSAQAKVSRPSRILAMALSRCFPCAMKWQDFQPNKAFPRITSSGTERKGLSAVNDPWPQDEFNRKNLQNRAKAWNCGLYAPVQGLAPGQHSADGAVTVLHSCTDRYAPTQFLPDVYGGGYMLGRGGCFTTVER